MHQHNIIRATLSNQLHNALRIRMRAEGQTFDLTFDVDFSLLIDINGLIKMC
jgi:hypothetical protein